MDYSLLPTTRPLAALKAALVPAYWYVFYSASDGRAARA